MNDGTPDIEQREARRANRRRRARGEAIVRDYHAKHEGRGESLETAATDLIADILHSFSIEVCDEIIERAMNHYAAEWVEAGEVIP